MNEISLSFVKSLKFIKYLRKKKGDLEERSNGREEERGALGKD